MYICDAESRGKPGKQQGVWHNGHSTTSYTGTRDRCVVNVDASAVITCVIGDASCTVKHCASHVEVSSLVEIYHGSPHMPGSLMGFASMSACDTIRKPEVSRRSDHTLIFI